MQKEIDSVKLFGLIRLSAGQSPQMLQKRFLQLLHQHFPPSNKLHKIFNKNTVKASYCCTQNVASIIKSHIKKLINTSIKNTLQCNCRKKHECPLDGKCRAENIVYKCVASLDWYPNKVYLGTAEGDFKQRFYNHRMPFNNEDHSTDTTLSKYVWVIKKKFKISPSLKWFIIKSVPAYSNISRNFSCICKKSLNFSITPIQINCLIKEQSLFQSDATLISFYCQIINLTIRPSEKCPIRNI